MSDAYENDRMDNAYRFHSQVDDDESLEDAFAKMIADSHFEALLAAAYSAYLTNTSSLIQQRGREDESPSDFILGRQLHEVGMRK